MSSPSTIRALLVLPQPVGLATPEKKRKVTPSAAQSPAKRSLILLPPDSQAEVEVDENHEVSISPFYAPRQLFPGDKARVTQEFTLPHAVPKLAARHSQAHEPLPVDKSRHILLPFDLRDESIRIIENSDIMNLLFNIFPGTIQVGEGRNRSFLNFTVTEMPKEPWPLTVGGLPITICTSSQGRATLFPMNRLTWGNTSISICPHLDGLRTDTFSDNDMRSIAAELFRELKARCPGVQLIEVMFPSEQLFGIVLGNGTDISAIRSRLPGTIANCAAGYILDHEIKRPAWADNKARRDILPQPAQGVVDDTAYDLLRPGVLVRSTKYRTLFLNSPFTGNVEGMVAISSCRLERGPNPHPTEERLRYVMYQWIFVGQVEGATNPHVPPDGTCGSTILDDQDRVVGFFCYYVKDGPLAGYCATVSASEVVDAGYRLA